MRRLTSILSHKGGFSLVYAMLFCFFATMLSGFILTQSTLLYRNSEKLSQLSFSKAEFESSSFEKAFDVYLLAADRANDEALNLSGGERTDDYFTAYSSFLSFFLTNYAGEYGYHVSRNGNDGMYIIFYMTSSENIVLSETVFDVDISSPENFKITRIYIDNQ